MDWDLKIRCYGREREIGRLRERVRTLDRSVTLVTGDSGIGKTTILRELRDRVRGNAALAQSDQPKDWLAHDFTVGYFECNRSTSQDPLLYALQDLLGSLVADGAPLSEALDYRSLNIDTFNPIYVLMGYALPKEAQPRSVHRAGDAQAGVDPEVSNRGETPYSSGGLSAGFAIWAE